ncbi:MAG: hypothetical protein ACM3WV_12455 [Bacillota bacterium]
MDRLESEWPEVTEEDYERVMLDPEELIPFTEEDRTAIEFFPQFPDFLCHTPLQV